MPFSSSLADKTSVLVARVRGRARPHQLALLALLLALQFVNREGAAVKLDGKERDIDADRLSEGIETAGIARILSTDVN